MESFRETLLDFLEKEKDIKRQLKKGGPMLIKALVKRYGSYRRVGKITGHSFGHLSKVVKGKENISPVSFLKLRRYLD